MRKILAFLAALAILGTAGTAAAYTVQKGDTLWKIAKNSGTTVRAIALKNGLTNPNHITVGQKIDIPVPQSGGMLGAANPLPEDGYDTYISSPVGVSDATIFVSRLPTVVTSSVYTIFASDGKTVSEKVFCIGVSTTPSNKLTGCVRGLATAPNGGAITEAAGTGVVHSKNARIAITDNINFTGKVLSILNGVQPTGVNVFRLGDGTTTTDKCYIFDDSTQVTKLCKNVTTGMLYWTLDGSNTYTFASSSVSQLFASSTRAISIVNSLISVNVSSTTGGAFGPDGSLYQKVSSTRGIASDSNGLYVATTTNLTWGGTQTFATTTITTSTLISANITTETVASSSIQVLNVNTTTIGNKSGSNINYLLFSTTTDRTFSNTTAVQPLIPTTTIKGGTLGIGNVIHIHLGLSALGFNNNATLNFALSYGGSNCISTSVGNVNEVTGFSGAKVDYFIYANGTGAQECEQELIGIEGGINDEAINPGNVKTLSKNVNGTAAVDSTIDQTLQINWNFSAGSTNSNVTVDNSYAEVLKL